MSENTEPQAGTEAAPPATPPWGSDDEFDPQKAWNLIQGLKADKEKLSARPVLTDEMQAELAEWQRLKEA